jgi:hypothetical protein
LGQFNALDKWNRDDYLAADLFQRRVGEVSLSLGAKGLLKTKELLKNNFE